MDFPILPSGGVEKVGLGVSLSGSYSNVWAEVLTNQCWLYIQTLLLHGTQRPFPFGLGEKRESMDYAMSPYAWIKKR